MAVVFSNNGKTTLAANVSSSATSISVADGSVFPSLGSGEVFFCTFDDGTNNEIVKVTAISSNTLTVVRAQESTTARAFSAGDAAELRLTAGILSLFTQTGSSIDDEIESYLDANGLTFPDDVRAKFGAGNDLQILHNGNDSFITNYTSDLYITNTADDSDIIFRSDDGSGSYTTYFYLDGSQQNTNFAKDIIFGDNKKALFGGSGDLQIYHTGNHSYISDAGTGNLYIRADSLDLRRYANGEQYLTADANGAVTLFHDGVAKVATSATGMDVTGDIESTGRFHVDTSDSTLPNLYFSAERYNDSNGKLIFGVAELSPSGGTIGETFIGNHNRRLHLGSVFDGTQTATASVRHLMIDEDGDLYVSQNNSHTQWFQASTRNLNNIGTISSGAITSSGTVSINQGASFSKLQIGTDRTGATENIGAVEFLNSSDALKAQVYGSNDGKLRLTTNGSTVALTLDASQHASFAGNITAAAGNIQAGNSSTGKYVRAHYSDGSYMTLQGYGLEMNRTTSYIRPTTDGNKTLYFGGVDASLDWAAIHFRSLNGLYMTGTRFLTTDRNLENIGTINATGSITSSGTFTGSSSELLRRYVSSWTVPTQTVLGNYYGSNLNDYIYLKVPGNSTTAHGIALITDNAFYYGRTSIETGQVTNDATSPLNESTGFKVTYDGDATFAGALEAESFSDGTISGITFIDEDSFASNSATKIPTQQSIKAYVDAQVSGVVDSAPGALNTLNELAAALGDDANFATTTSTSLGNRLRVDTASQGLTGTQQANAIANLGITATKAELNYVDGVTSNIQTQLDSKLSSFDITTQTDPKYLRSNASDTATGVLTFNGTSTFNGVVNLNATTNFDASGQQIVLDTDGARRIFDFTRNGNVRMSLNALSGQDAFNFDFTSGNDLRINNNRILTTADEGSGNGIDADQLDGQHGSYYLNYNNLTNKPTIPTNNNQLTNGAGYITSFDITTQTDSKYLRSDVSDVYAGRTLSFGIPGNGTNTSGSFFSIEGNTDGSGEGSGRIFFREHNSSTAAEDNYGMSLGYRGGSTSITTAGGSTNQSAALVNNGQWFMVGHDGSNQGALIMYGDRAATFVNFASNNITGVGNITLSGTVDGRDVATDGTKLDTIDTNADVTPSWVPSSNPNYITSSSNITGTAAGLSGTPNITVGTLNATEFSGHIEAGGHLDFNIGVNHGTTGNADRWWISQHSTGQSDVPGTYYDIINLSSSSTHGIQLAARYGSSDDQFWIRSRSDNSNAPAGVGLQAWKRLFHEDYHPNADKLTTARTIAGTSFDGSANIDINYNNLTNLPTIPSLSGYATESYVTTQINNLIDSAPGALNTLNELAAAIGDDASFSTTITNSIAAKLPLAGGTMTGDITMGANQVDFNAGGGNSTSAQIIGDRSTTDLNSRVFTTEGGLSYTTYDSSTSNKPGGTTNNANGVLTINTHGGSYNHQLAFTNGKNIWHRHRDGGSLSTWDRLFTDSYHPNADKWTTARTLSLSGDASGSVSWDGSANATLSVTVADDSHNHVISNVDGLQTALDAKLTSSSNLNASNLSSGTVATARLPEFIEERFIYNSNDTNGVYMPMVKGGMYSTGQSSVTGAIKIKIPDTMDKDNNMMQFYVDIYEYTTGESMTFRISGYTYNNQTWYNTSVVNLSDDTDRDFTVRFYGNETNDTSYVAIGETNSTWAYPQVNVRDWFSGYNTSEAESQGTWEISFVTSFDGTLRQTHNNNFPAVEVGNINGLTSTVTELNYTDGVTSNIQTQLNAKLASSSYTASDVLTKIKTVDGSGSGLDADLLDGQHGSYYAPISSPSFSSKITTPQIHNSNVISVLNGSSAQGMKVASIYAGTSYSNSAPSGMVNALNGFQVGNTTVINSSRQLDNIDSITITGQASGGTVLGLENNSWVSLKDNGGTLQRVLGASSNTLYVGDVDADFTNMYLRGPSTMYVQTNNTTALTIDSSQVATFANDIVIPDRINHAGDTDTYMQFSAANVWRVVAAGSQVIKATGTTFEVDKTLHAESGIIAFGTSPVITSRASDSEIVLKSQNESASNADQFHIAHQAGNVQLYNARGNMRYYMGSNSATYIEGDGDYAEVNTAYGYTRIGPNNTTYSHFITDRGKFYFNKTVQVDGDILPHDNDTRDLGSTAQAFKELHVEDIRFHNANGAVGGIGQYNAAGDIEILSDHNIVFKETDGNAIKAVFGLNGPNFTFGQTTENTSYRVYVNGSIASTADVTAYASDERLKTNIVEIDNPIEKVKQLRGVTFDWQDDVEEKGFEPAAKHETGVIAQEIQKVIPDAVVPAPFDPDYLTVKHEKIVPLLIEAIKEQQKEIEELKQHSHKPRNLDEMEGFDTLVEQINSLKDEIKKLKGEE